MKAIVAVDKNWGIGQNGEQLCYIPEDLKRFQTLTTGHPILLGRKTLSTFPGGRPLKNRRNLILSAHLDYSVENAEVYHSLEAALAAAPEDTFVVGGESVYRQTLEQCDTVYVTKIDQWFEADRHFPNLDESPEWEVAETDGPYTFEDMEYTYVTYRRK